MKLARTVPYLFAGVASIVLAQGCGRPEPGCDSDNGRSAIVESVDNALNTQDCAGAIAAISPYYEQDGCGTDPIRFARGAAYACRLGLNFFTAIDRMKDADFDTPTGFFDTATKLYPAASGDGAIAAGNLSLDALFALQVGGSVSGASDTIYGDTVSPGTLIASNRTRDANIYGMLVSMGMLGATHSRSGTPDADSKITTKLGATSSGGAGWEIASNMTADGCAYAGSLLTFVDSVNEVALDLSQRFGSKIADKLKTVALSLPLDAACSLGCSGASGSGCNVSCSACPQGLRSRRGCATGSSSDVEACAASGIVKAVNTLYGL